MPVFDCDKIKENLYYVILLPYSLVPIDPKIQCYYYHFNYAT